VLFPSGSGDGTGVLVGKHHVLTAGHNIFNPSKGGWAQDVKVVPGYNNGHSPYGTSRAVKLTAMIGFTEYHDVDYDLGIIITKDDIGVSTGWFGMMPTDGADLRTANLHIVGYPNEGSYDGELLEDTTCAVTDTNDHKVFYRTNTYQGLSGAPIFLQVRPYGYSEPGGIIVGVHTTGDDNENSGPKLRREIWNWISGSLAMSNSRIAGLWLLAGNTLRISVNGDRVRAVYEKVVEQPAVIRPGYVEFQGILANKKIVGKDTIFYGYSSQEVQCGVAGKMIDVDIVLEVSQDESSMTGGVWYPAPDPYCRFGSAYQQLTLTRVTASTR
jgi:V8-like Glu-specific endopeptidase